MTPDAASGVCLFLVLGSWIKPTDQVKEGAAIPCSKTDPQLGECLIKASPHLFASFEKAHPDYNRKAKDPMQFDTVESKSGGGSFGLSFKLEDNVLTGLAKAKIEDLKIDLKNHEIILTAICPKCELSTNYELSGNIMILPITGKGKAHIILKNAYIDLYVKWYFVKRNGTRFIQTRSFSYGIRPGRTHFQFDNLFNGDKFMGPQMNQFMNDNDKEVIKVFLPTVEKALEQHDTKELDDALATIPYDQLFLD